ncbi:MAG: ribonuclease H-like domain-containing protein [Myxococcales bacterium]|nr:ribonuclease H-like domain-containing protein [Myxococcales bacterium]
MTTLRRKLERRRAAGEIAPPAAEPDARARGEQAERDRPLGATAPAVEPDAGARGGQAEQGFFGFEGDRSARIARLREAIDRVGARSTRGPTSGRAEARGPTGGARPAFAPAEAAEVEPLGGDRVQTESGPLRVFETWLSPEHRHGRAPIAGALDVPARTVAQLALDASFERVALGDMLFIDTETTGLAGGTGTIPFLIGVAWFEERALHVEQLFLERLGAEAPMLARLAERLERASCVVSYNGKSFDWPLLRTRFVMNRVKAPPLPPHLDLLHCARRVVRERVESMRLVELERALLGMERVDDVPGAQVPALYRAFVETSNGALMRGVLEHNVDDLVALAALLGWLARRYDVAGLGEDPSETLAFARVAARAGDEARAARLAEAAAGVAAQEPAPQTVDAWMLRAWLARRAGEVAVEGAALRAALEACGSGERGDLPGARDDRRVAEVHLALAKHYEHRARDKARALHHALRTVPAESDAACARRVARLEAR